LEELPIKDLTIEEETFLFISKYFNVPPLELLEYPEVLYNDMIRFIETTRQRSEIKQFQIDSKQRLKAKYGRT